MGDDVYRDIGRMEPIDRSYHKALLRIKALYDAPHKYFTDPELKKLMPPKLNITRHTNLKYEDEKLTEALEPITRKYLPTTKTFFDKEELDRIVRNLAPEYKNARNPEKALYREIVYPLFACVYWDDKPRSQNPIDRKNQANVQLILNEDRDAYVYDHDELGGSSERMTVVNHNPELILQDYLTETGKGLTSYPFMSDENRERVDNFFLHHYTKEMKGVCVILHKKNRMRMQLVKAATDIVRIIANSDVPIECIEMIFQYLASSELENFIKAVDRNFVLVE